MRPAQIWEMKFMNTEIDAATASFHEVLHVPTFMPLLEHVWCWETEPPVIYQQASSS